MLTDAECDELARLAINPGPTSAPQLARCRALIRAGYTAAMARAREACETTDMEDRAQDRMMAALDALR